MTRRENLEAALALAMLPVGGVLALGSALAVLAFTFLAMIGLPFGFPAWLELWLIVASLVAVRNTVESIEIMSAFDWRPAVSVVALWAVTIAVCPAWW